MILADIHVELLKRVRNRIATRPGNYYICLIVQEEAQIAKEAELNLLRNRIMFWRRYSIHDKWMTSAERMARSVQYALDGTPTFGSWFETQRIRRGINVDCGSLNNRGWYQEMRLAWLDKMIESRTIA